MSHTCHAINCTIPCPPTHLLCRDHWKALPARIQNRVMKAYRPGQCKDRRPSEAFIAAAREAQEYIAEREAVSA